MLVVVVDLKKIANPDTDLNALIPDLIERHSCGTVLPMGWDYADDDSMHLFFEALDRVAGVQATCAALASAPVLGNNLSGLLVAWRLANEGPFTVAHPPEFFCELVDDHYR